MESESEVLACRIGEVVDEMSMAWSIVPDGVLTLEGRDDEVESDPLVWDRCNVDDKISMKMPGVTAHIVFGTHEHRAI